MQSRNKVAISPQPVEPQSTQTRQEKIQGFLHNIQSKIAEQIDNDGVKVSNKKIPYSIKKIQPGQLLSSKLKEMHQSRLKMQERLHSLTEEERQLKIKERINRQSQSRIDEKNKSIMRPRSQLTQQDLIVLKKLKRQQKQFQLSLEKKTKEHQEMLKKIKEEEEKLKEKQLKEKGESRLQQVKKRLDFLEKHKAEREVKFQEEKRKIAQLHAKKKLYQQLERTQREKDKQQMQQKVSKMTQRFKKREVDREMLKEHEEKYLDFKTQQKFNKQEKQQLLEELARERKSQLSKLQKSKYYTLVIDQDRKKKQEYGARERERFKLHQASMQYAQQVKRDHSPQVRIKTASSQDKQKREIGLSFEQTKANGNLYMKLAKKFIKKKNTQRSQKEISVELQTRAASTKYRDYLSERRKARGKQQEMSRTDEVAGIKDRKIRKDIEQVEKLVHSGDVDEEKMNKIRGIARKLEMQPNDHSMLDKISAKIKILETLANK